MFTKNSNNIDKGTCGDSWLAILVFLRLVMGCKEVIKFSFKVSDRVAISVVITGLKTRDVVGFFNY